MAPAHLAPFEPGRDGPWDPKRAVAHLLRRSGFGAPPADLERVMAQVGKDGLEAAVKDLFNEDPEYEAASQQVFEWINGFLVDFGEAEKLRAWWCHRMLRTRTPLREKLALFWHGHFATNANKVEDLSLMYHQGETLRALAWGNFRDLLAAVSRDPAMLIYLDGEANTREHPNENFARELLELFTLGIGHYTEKDVREVARAFTGYGREGKEFRFDPDHHDSGRKHFLGQHGNFNGAHILDIILKHPALPRFIARKLLVFFACPEPPEEVVTEAADVFRRGSLNVKEFLQTLFLSKFFFGPQCRRTRIASPVEYVIGTCRTLGCRFTGLRAQEHLDAMGQELYAPPSVKGWDGEKKWINSLTWAGRVAFGRALADLDGSFDGVPNLDVGALVPTELIHPERVVDALVDLLFQGDLDAAKRGELARFLVTTGDGPRPERFRDDADFREHQIREALGVMMSLPEYHAY